jgi:hypothetical protein
MDSMVARTYTLDESQANLGIARWSIVFETSNDLGAPRVSESTPSDTLAQQAAVDNLTTAFLGQLVTVGGTALDAADKLSETATTLDDINKSIVAGVQVGLDAVNKFRRDVTDVLGSVNALVAAPAAMGQAISDLFAALEAVYNAPVDVFNTMKAMFAFGYGLDIPFLGTATGLSIQRQENRDLLNNGANTLALTYAYTAAAQIDFETVEEIETASEALEDQYQLLLDNSLDRDTSAALTEQRGIVLDIFAQAKLTARQITEVRTNLSTYRLLSYQYYGFSDDGESLALLNDAKSLTALGNVEILTP